MAETRDQKPISGKSVRMIPAGSPPPGPIVSFGLRLGPHRRQNEVLVLCDAFTEISLGNSWCVANHGFCCVSDIPRFLAMPEFFVGSFRDFWIVGRWKLVELL